MSVQGKCRYHSHESFKKDIVAVAVTASMTEMIYEGFIQFSCLHAAVEIQETTSDSSESTDDSETSSGNDNSDNEEGKYTCSTCNCLVFPY